MGASRFHRKRSGRSGTRALRALGCEITRDEYVSTLRPRGSTEDGSGWQSSWRRRSAARMTREAADIAKALRVVTVKPDGPGRRSSRRVREPSKAVEPGGGRAIRPGPVVAAPARRFTVRGVNAERGTTTLGEGDHLASRVGAVTRLRCVVEQRSDGDGRMEWLGAGEKLSRLLRCDLARDGERLSALD